MAYDFDREAKTHRLIAVMLSGISQCEELEATIQNYLRYHTYIEYGSKYFWENLLYNLPVN